MDESEATIADTDDGNDQTFVIPKDNIDELEKKLSQNIETMDDLDASKNIEIREELGYDINDMEKNASPEFETGLGNGGDNGFRMGYQIGYESAEGKKMLTFLAGQEDHNFKIGATTGRKVGGRHLRQGKMNMFKPQLKNNPARIQTNQRARGTQISNYGIIIGGKSVNTILPTNN